MTVTSGGWRSPGIGVEAGRGAQLRFGGVVGQVRTVDEQRRAILLENTAELYGIDVPELTRVAALTEA